MRRALLSFAVLLVITGFQFTVYPGHTYLVEETQVLVPQLERLESPGMLGRDPVAVNAHLTYTVYDEAALFLHRIPQVDFKTALLLQLVLCRLAGLGGILLLATAGGLHGWWRYAVAAAVGLMGDLPGIMMAPLAGEPCPWSLAFGPALLSAGLFARYKPLLAGLCGGLALIYDPRIAAPLWTVLILAFLFDRRVRPVIRPSLTVFAIFALLLANFAQLQPSTTEPRTLFERIPPVIEGIQQSRIPRMWVANWEPRIFLLYLALALLCASSLVRLWPRLQPMLRWLLTGLGAVGFVGVPASYLLLDVAHRRVALLLEPATALLFTAAVGILLCFIAALQISTKERWVFVAGPLLLILASWRPPSHASEDNIGNAANWARNSTWGAAAFLFPDTGRSLIAGRFRAEAQRAVWVDWETGRLCASSDTFADEWNRRWKDTMEGDYSQHKLRRLLTLPIDYYVLSPAHQIKDVRPVFSDNRWLIYDAHELRQQLAPE